MLTWNLWWRFGEPERRATAIASVLRAARPDVCGLQEVWSGEDGNLAERLAAELDMHWTWAEWRAPAQGIGNAVLSRWPIVEQEELTLPAAPGNEAARVALATVLQTPAGQLPFATTHLDPEPDASATRCEQVRALAGFLEPLTGLERPLVLTGDLNAEPDSDEVRLLCGHKTAPVRPGFVLVDAWRYADPSATPWTWDRANPHARESGEPSARIDYVLVAPPREGTGGAVASAERIGAEPVDGVWPSDHAGVLAEVRP